MIYIKDGMLLLEHKSLIKILNFKALGLESLDNLIIKNESFSSLIYKKDSKNIIKFFFYLKNNELVYESSLIEIPFSLSENILFKLNKDYLLIYDLYKKNYYFLGKEKEQYAKIPINKPKLYLFDKFGLILDDKEVHLIREGKRVVIKISLENPEIKKEENFLIITQKNWKNKKFIISLKEPLFGYSAFFPKDFNIKEIF